MVATRPVTMLALLAGAALSLFAMLPHAQADPPVAGTCGTAANPLTGMKFITSTFLSTTDSGDYANFAEAGVKFTQARTGCVVVSFSAQAYVSNQSGAGIQVRAVLDGTTVCEPPGVSFGGFKPDGHVPASAMSFVCKGITAGEHTLRMQFRLVGLFPATGHVHTRTTIVQFMQ